MCCRRIPDGCEAVIGNDGIKRLACASPHSRQRCSARTAIGGWALRGSVLLPPGGYTLRRSGSTWSACSYATKPTDPSAIRLCFVPDRGTPAPPPSPRHRAQPLAGRPYRQRLSRCVACAEARPQLMSHPFKRQHLTATPPRSKSQPARLPSCTVTAGKRRLKDVMLLIKLEHTTFCHVTQPKRPPEASWVASASPFRGTRKEAMGAVSASGRPNESISVALSRNSCP